MGNNVNIYGHISLESMKKNMRTRTNTKQQLNLALYRYIKKLVRSKNFVETFSKREVIAYIASV